MFFFSETRCTTLRCMYVFTAQSQFRQNRSDIAHAVQGEIWRETVHWVHSSVLNLAVIGKGVSE